MPSGFVPAMIILSTYTSTIVKPRMSDEEIEMGRIDFEQKMLFKILLEFSNQALGVCFNP